MTLFFSIKTIAIKSFLTELGHLSDFFQDETAWQIYYFSHRQLENQRHSYKWRNCRLERLEAYDKSVQNKSRRHFLDP